jgi:hypothetical protein
MSDTALGALGDPKDTLTEVDVTDERWKKALSSDIVVAHVSDVPSGEIRQLAGLTTSDDTEQVRDFDACVRSLAEERPPEADRLMHALSLAGRRHGAINEPAKLLQPTFLDGPQLRQHLYLHGLLAVSKQLLSPSVSVTSESGPRVLVIGEFREQLGSFRGTIAREINERVFKPTAGDSVATCHAVTADIGLRIRLADAGVRNTILCSTCSHNNDRLDCERFHRPQQMREVCVKGDHEAMYWNCWLHDTGNRDSGAVFVERMGGYDPFAGGGRYHG